MFAFVRVRQGVETGDDILVGDAHHDVGVIDGLALFVNGGEDLGGIAGLSAKIEEDGLVGPGREAGVGDLVVAVEHHATGAFEIKLFVFIFAEVEGPVDMEGFAKLFQNGGFALVAAIRGVHGIETDDALVMEGDPVIRKDGIGSKGFRGVVDDRYIDIVVAEDSDERVEFLLRLLLGIGRGRGLEGVVDGGFRIETEVHRPDHQDVGCRLHCGSFRVRRGEGACSCNGNRRGRAIVRRRA